jgi:hypothetical protein
VFPRRSARFGRRDVVPGTCSCFFLVMQARYPEPGV